MVTQFTINETRVPDQVRAAINAKVAMIQDAWKTQIKDASGKAVWSY